MKFFLFFATLIISVRIFAAEGQFFFQPEEGQHVATPQLSTGIIRVTFPDETLASFEDTTTVRTLTGSLEYEYGLLENLSFGIQQSYSYTDISFETQSNISRGLDDLFIFSKGFVRIAENWTLRYGVGANLSLENSTSENEYSGRNEIDPYIGIDTLVKKRHRIGGRASYSFLLGKEKQESSTGTVSEFTGGESLNIAAFYEFNWDNGLVGVSPSYMTVFGTKNGTSTSDTQRLIANQIYANFFFTKNFTLIPTVASTLLLNDELNGTEIKSYTGVLVGLGARFKF